MNCSYFFGFSELHKTNDQKLYPEYIQTKHFAIY